MANDPRNPEKMSKGGLVTSRNPFVGGANSIAPKLAEHAGFGIAVDTVLAGGCALIVGRTRDGGAISLTVLDGDERHRGYAANHKELDNLLGNLMDKYEQKR